MRNFTGKLLLTSLNGKGSYLLDYVNGKLSETYKKNQFTFKKLQSVGGTTSYWETQCQTVMRHCSYTSTGYSYCGGQIEVIYSFNCNWPQPRCGVSYYMTDSSEETICEQVWFPDPPTDPGNGNGNGSGSGTSIAQEFITTELQNECLKEVVEDLLNYKDLGNKISSIIQDVFKQSEKYRVTFYERTNLPDMVMADEAALRQNDGTIDISIRLNLKVLQGSSREFIASTIMHEIVHGYLDIINKTNTEGLDHNIMATDYVNSLQSALQSMYGTNVSEANALAWGGLHNTDKWSQLLKGNIENTNNILNINQEHMKGSAGTKGTKCGK